MSSDNKQLVQRHLNLAWNQGAFDEISHFLAADFHYKTTFTDEILDAPRYIEFIQVFREAMPNLMLEVELAMAEGKHVMTQVSFFGIVEKPVYGIPASDKIITFHAMSVWEVQGKRIISLDTLIDIAGLERQLGIQVMPHRPLKARLSSSS
jgi:steroid delta-isomerase-like uncharacterized protein